MTLSVGQLHSARQLLDLVASAELTAKALADGLASILVCPVAEVLNLSTRCGWVLIDMDGILRPSVRGREVQEKKDFQERLREQMKDIIICTQPAWTKMIPRGRAELARFVPPDVRQCFDEAGLMRSSPTPEIVDWWDELSERSRGLKSSFATEIGRRGERLSLVYEERRTGREPLWQSVESNLSGFDILSINSSDDNTPLQIEVKASERSIEFAVFHLTDHEWEVAQLSRAHIFHFWLLSSPPKLARITTGEVTPHVPGNNGEGTWEKAAIPFRVFERHLTPVQS
jgi:hypothetical protein